ncbi:MAG: EamA family transporter [Planctomycetota bacterium]|nr:EamA family transporter [Planctomycetota bacterium]
MRFPRSSRRCRGRWWLVAAALLWSTSGAFGKSPLLVALPEELRGLIVAFFRAFFAFLVLVPFIRPSMIRWNLALIPLLACFTVMNVLFISSMTYTTAANAVVLQYTAPLWMFLGAIFLLQEPFDRKNLVSLALGLGGVAWLIGGSWNSPDTMGILMALGSGVAYAGVALCLRYLREESPVWLITMCHLISALVLLPWMVHSGVLSQMEGWSVYPVPLLSWSLLTVLFLFGALQMAVPYVMFSKGVQSISSQEAGIITLIEPLTNPLWVYLLWGERFSSATLCGGALILSGLIHRLFYDSQDAA